MRIWDALELAIFSRFVRAKVLALNQIVRKGLVCSSAAEC